MALDTHSLVQSLLNKNRQATTTAQATPAPAEATVPTVQEETVAVAQPQPVPLDDDDTSPTGQAPEPLEGTEETDQEIAPEILYPELKAKVDAAEDLLENGLLPRPSSATATEDQQEEAADLIHAYFELTDPVVKDHVLILLAANPSDDATNFFATALEEDPDAYVHSQAAEVLYRRGLPSGSRALLEILEGPEDIAQLNHAIMVLSQVDGLKIAPKLLNIWQDEYRDSEERIEALLGLEQIMGKGLESSLLGFIDNIEDAAGYIPEDELEQVLNIFARQEAVKAVPHLQALSERLKKSCPDLEDIQPLLEDIESTIAQLS